jgi:hypothetical protein
VAVTVLAAAVLFRAIRVCSQTEGGWKILRDHVFAGLPPIFSRAESSDQTILINRWQRLLNVADRLAVDSNATASDCMGIAWLLAGYSAFKNESPDPAVVGRMLWLNPPSPVTSGDWQQMYETTAGRARHLAARATELEPDRLDWWRLRALLIIWPLDHGEFDIDALKTALKHDPENSLYDYLLAAAAMNRAFAEKQTDEGPARYIADNELFEEGKRLYQQAASKKFLACGEDGFPTTIRALTRIDAPLNLKLA